MSQYRIAPLYVFLSLVTPLFAGDIDNRNIIKDFEKSIPTNLRPTKILSKPSENLKTTISSYLLKDKELKLIKALPFTLKENICRNKFYVNVHAKLSNRFFKVSKRRIYKISATIKCFSNNKLIFKERSNEGNVVSIFNIAQTAVDKFTKIHRISFWDKQISLKWPSRGDYYSFKTVHITKAHQWDVIGHELGHAIYDLGNIGRHSGGSHRIDECHNKTLAFSEGWASFFSAFLKIDLNDPDAKFEFMVKRRAPVRIEEIPDDVCFGQTNEWRVTGFLWDLIDSNKDNETMNESFLKLWDASFNKQFASLEELVKTLKRKSFNRELLTKLWAQNIRP